MSIFESVRRYLGMNWLRFNRVNINYIDKTMLFPEPGEEKISRFVTVDQVMVSLKEEAQVFVMFASLKVEGESRVAC